MILRLPLLLSVALILLFPSASRAEIVPTDLRCEDLVRPLGVDNPAPRLSWSLHSVDRGQIQTAYQVQVARSKEDYDVDFPEAPHVIWDSDKVVSDATRIVYAPAMLPLHSDTDYWWRVRVWDRQGIASSWSRPTLWSTGLLEATDWQGSWITTPPTIKNGPLFRKEFELSHIVTRAIAYVCGLGYYELYINGKRVGDHVLDPAQTDYPQRALYVAHDVSRYLKEGKNVIAIQLGNGWFNQDRVWGGMSYGRPCARLQMNVRNDVDFMTRISTDDTWRCSSGPITSDNVYAGETFDARLDPIGWTRTGFNDSQWLPVQMISSPARQLVAQTMPPIRRTETLKAIKDWSPSPGVRIYDFGQNFAGWTRIQVRAPEGTTLRMRSAETIDANGALDTASTGVFATGVEQVDTYVVRGDKKGQVPETYEPHFTYHGFRYVEVTGLSPRVSLDRIEGVVVHTAVETTGQFESSDAMLNRIHRAALWTQRSNLHGIPTDCPAREKCGWLGDAGITAEMTLYNFRMTRFWDKYIRDIVTSWRPEMAGHDRPGDVAPGKRITGPNGNVDWGATVVLIPWYLYLYTGDTVLLGEQYPNMARFVRNVRALMKDGIVEQGYGDWCPPGSVQPVETPAALTTTAVYYQAILAAQRAAHALDKPEEEAEFATLAESVRVAFLRHFYLSDRHSFGSQTGDAVALALGLVPPGEEANIAADLTKDVVQRHAGHHATGIFGSRWLYDMLCRYGSGGTAMEMLHATTYPSFGDLFAKGATTLWECWGEAELDKKWGARSLNHPMQGGFDAWLYQGLAGIRPDPDAPGFKHFTIQPQMPGDLQWVRVSCRAPQGEIRSAWRREKERVTVEVTIPPGTTATLYLPTTRTEAITERSDPAAQAPGVHFEGTKGPNAVFTVGSGRYRFAYPLGSK